MTHALIIVHRERTLLRRASIPERRSTDPERTAERPGREQQASSTSFFLSSVTGTFTRRANDSKLCVFSCCNFDFLSWRVCRVFVSACDAVAKMQHFLRENDPSPVRTCRFWRNQLSVCHSVPVNRYAYARSGGPPAVFASPQFLHEMCAKSEHTER